MIRNYIKIAFRSLIRDRAFSILNLIGLAVGLASVIMIIGYIRYELSYDKSYSNYARVYRLLQENKNGAGSDLSIRTPVGLAATFQKEFAGINSHTLTVQSEMQFKYHDEMVSIKQIEGSAEFFKVFNFTFLKGNPNTALNDPGSAVVTESTAKKYFADKNPIGASIADNTGNLLHVTGVVKDIPANTHFAGDIIISLAGKKYTEEMLNWQAYTSMPQYLLLDKTTDPVRLESQFKTIYKKYKFPENVAIHLQMVTDIHLRSHAQDEISPNGDIKYVYIFLSAALLILFIACINYINLTTARSLQRAKEIGLRKVLGALRRQLIAQFLTESFLFFLLSTLLALLITYTLWPLFSIKITGYQQVLPIFDMVNLGIIFFIFVTGGLLSGAYPAFFLSSLQPVKVLKGLTKFGINISIRKALVVLQFVISGVLIVATIVIYQQLEYINNARLGFNKVNLITVPFWVRNSHISTFKNELNKSSDIQSVSVASWQVGIDYGSWASMTDKRDTTKQIKFQFIDGDADFIKTVGINILQGRNFLASRPLDMADINSSFRKHLTSDDFNHALASKSILLNQEAVKQLGLSNPIGKVIKTGAVQGTVIGVVENFNGLTLHQKISPVIIRCSSIVEFGTMYIRISPNNTQKTINYIENQWKKFYPDHRFDFVFADDKLQQLYTADKRLGTLFGAFASLAIIIACLGLFGLISLTVQNRIKEIGIRKVLGASVFDITNLISVDFLRLVVVSFFISSPVAWYLMNTWLQSFAYRIEMHWWIFLIAFTLAVVISLITLSFQSIKAAVANPGKSLRSE
jgi:putative ABC transport system permease protein